MRFRHTCNVMVDNSRLVYKQLIFRVVVSIIAGILYAVCIGAFVSSITGSTAMEELISGVGDFISDLLNGRLDGLEEISASVQEAFEEVMDIIRDETGTLILGLFIVFIIRLAETWVTEMLNLSTGMAMNDKMTMRAKTSIMSTLIQRFGKIALYSIYYSLISVVFDWVVMIGMFFLLYYLVTRAGMSFLFAVFIFILVFVLATAVKMMFTTDWVPALACDNMTEREAIRYSFSRSGKNSGAVFMTYVFLVLLIMVANVLAAIATFGVALLLTIPGSYVLILSYELVNYKIDNKEDFYTSEDNMVTFEKKEITTSKEFFGGDDEN